MSQKVSLWTSFWLSKNALISIQLLKSASICGLGGLACEKPLFQEIFSPGIVPVNDEVPLCAMFVFDIWSNESFFHNRKRPDKIEKCSTSGG